MPNRPPPIEELTLLTKLAMKWAIGGRKFRDAPTTETGKSGYGLVRPKSSQPKLAPRASTAAIFWLPRQRRYASHEASNWLKNPRQQGRS